jgi:DUF1009 family protein
MISKLLIVSGKGTYPELLVKGAKSAGVERVDVVAIKGSTSRDVCKLADNVRWITLGEIASTIRWTGEEKYEGVIFAGQVNPLSLFRGRFDEEVKKWLSELKVKNAHSIFGKLSEKFEEVGVPVLPASSYMDGHIPGEGLLTNRPLTQDELNDITHAGAVVKDIGVHDIGQTVMVKSGMVLAVEAFEGTNAAIKRGGKLGGKGSILYKAAREGHDMRFDIPVVGLKTLKVMKKAGVTALAFQASRLVLLDKEKVIEYANKHSIAIVGFDSLLPPAPLRPL